MTRRLLVPALVAICTCSVIAAGCRNVDWDYTTTVPTFDRTSDNITTLPPTESQPPMTTTTEAPTTTTQASAPQAFAWGEELDMSGVIVQVSEPQLDTALSDAEKLFLDEGYGAFFVTVTIKNNSNAPFAYSPANFILSDSLGQVFKVGYLCSEPALEPGVVQEGRTVRGAVAFEMPLDSEPAFVDYFPDYELIGTPEDLAGTWGY